MGMLVGCSKAARLLKALTIGEIARPRMSSLLILGCPDVFLSISEKQLCLSEDTRHSSSAYVRRSEGEYQPTKVDLVWFSGDREKCADCRESRDEATIQF